MKLTERDKQYIWHPYTQAKTERSPIPVVKGKGAWLTDENGKKYLDAISSWWVNIHGHAHPYIAKKIAEQAKQLEQVIFAGFTHEPAVRLAERIVRLLPGDYAKVFYSDNGSTAVEVALKMAIQYWHNKGIHSILAQQRNSKNKNYHFQRRLSWRYVRSNVGKRTGHFHKSLYLFVI